jgi:hypothetical protein
MQVHEIGPEALPLSLVGEGVIDAMLECLETVGDGSIVEVGVYQGGTAYYLNAWAQRHGRECYLYDTFSGIPYADPIDTHKVGDFSLTSVESVRDLVKGARIIQGIFPESAVPMPPVAFVHIDVDQYRGYIETCRYLDPLMASGGVMWFDDADCIASAGQAVHELYGKRVEIGACNKRYVRFP